MRLFRKPSSPTGAPAGARPTPPPYDGPVTVAHRGASGDHPENTLAAVRAAVAAGARHVEVDVQRTRDGALVVVHDTTLARTTDCAAVLPGRGPWRVGDLTLDEVRRLDAGGWHPAGTPGERVPTLDDVVDALRGTGTGLLLEVKAPAHYPGIMADVAAQLRAAPDYLAAALAAGDLVVQSFDHAAVRVLKDIAPELPVGLLGAPPRRRLRSLAGWAQQVNPRHRAVNAGYVDAVHQAGMACQVWTVDEPADMARAVAMGVDGVITNRPAALRALLGGRVSSAA